MKGGTQAALAIAVGYVLGRRRKMRMATVLAAAAATGGITGIGGPLLRRGAKLLGSTELLGNVSPQFREIADTVRGDLIEAGKAAATAAVSGRIESLTDSLHERAETIRNPGAAAAKAGEAVGGLSRRPARTAVDDEADLTEDEAEFDDADEVEDEEQEPEPRRRSSRSGAPVARRRR